MSEVLDLSATVSELDTLLVGVGRVDDLLAHFAAFLARSFKLEKVALQVTLTERRIEFEYDANTNHGTHVLSNQRIVKNNLLNVNGYNYELPLFCDKAMAENETSLITALADELYKPEISTKCSTIAFVVITKSAEACGWVECYSTQPERKWENVEKLAFQKLINLLDRALQRTIVGNPITTDDESQHTIDTTKVKQRSIRLVQYGKLIILRTDLNFRIIEAEGDTRKIIGLTINELINNDKTWLRLLRTEEFRKLRQKLLDMKANPSEFEYELEVMNHYDNKLHTLLLNLIPLYDQSNNLIGWEGVGLDITEKRQTEKKLIQQSSRIEALYEITRNLQTNIDPAYVAFRGLKAIINATKSVSGYCVLYDRVEDYAEIVAAIGCSTHYLESLEKIMNKSNLSRHVIETKEGLKIDDVRKHPLAKYGLTAKEGLRSCLIMPLLYEDPREGTQVIGAIQIASRRVGRYTDEDFELMLAAATQIALVIKQADYYANEKKEASSLAVLYKLSHALSQVRDPAEIANSIFPIIRDVLACKRMWLGIVNEQSSHIVGSGSFGPGITEEISRIQVELQLRHDFLDQAIKTKRAIIVPAGSEMECSGLNKIIKRLQVGTFITLPLVALGQVVGVLVIEPMLGSEAYLNRKLGLLTSMANEMGTVVLARRLENRLAASDKMRMAGLLASGVAHNFNNLLQAVMGQASLIDMQLPEGSNLKNATTVITEAAARGAQLIKQMLSITNTTKTEKKQVDLNEMISTSQELYHSLLGSQIDLKLKLTEKATQSLIEIGQIQQVLSHLIINAREALTNKVPAYVEIVTEQVRLSSAEVDPNLAPGTYVKITVKDNGRGMNKEQMERCFEPFYTSKNTDANTGIGYDGSGFGLSLSYTILRQHDGMLLVHSEVGKGTEFNLYIPLSTTVKTEHVLDPINKTALIKQHALIIDSEKNAPLAIQATLDSLAISYEVFIDKNKAFEKLSKKNNTVTMLIVDLDCIDLLTINKLVELAQENLNLKIILTTSSTKLFADKFEKLANIRIIEKPLGVWAVHNTIRKLLFVDNNLILNNSDRKQTQEHSNQPNPVNNEENSGSYEKSK